MVIYPLPESQIDRFLMRINLGYPELEAEKIILKNSTTMNLDKIDVVFTDTELKKLFRIIEQIEVGDKVYDYLLSRKS